MDKKDMAQDKKMTKKAVGMHEKQLHGGKKSDLAMLKNGGKVKKMAMGGPTLPNQAAQQAVDAMSRRPTMPDQSNAGGAMRGLDRAAAMSGRDMSGMGRPSLPPVGAPQATGLDQAAAMSGRDFSGMGRPAGMKKGGKVKKMEAGGPTAPANMPAKSNFGGAQRGLERAAAMSGRDKSGMGKPAGMKKGGVTKCARGGGIEVRGKTKGKIC